MADPDTEFQKNERNMFERWIKSSWLTEEEYWPLALKRSHLGYYRNPTVREMWRAWLARASL